MEKEYAPLTLGWKIRIYIAGIMMICAGVFCFYWSTQNGRNISLFTLLAIGLTLLGVKLVRDTFRSKLITAEEEPIVQKEANVYSSELIKAKRLCKITNTIAVIVFLVVPIYPGPHNILVIIALVYPLICALIIFRNIDTVNLIVSKDDITPHLAAAFLLPPFGLFLHACLQFHLANYTNCILPVLAIAVLFGSSFYIIYYFQPKLKYNSFISIALISVTYGFGSCICVNCEFDNVAPQIYHPRVIGKSYSYGKSYTYYLLVESWGPRTSPANVTVYQWVYRRINIGQEINVSLKPGLFEIPWYTVLDK